MKYDGASFHMLICHLYIFFGVVSVKIFGPFYNQIVFLLLIFKSSLYILDNGSLVHVSFANIFSHSVTCLLILFDNVFCRAEVFYFNEVYLINYFVTSSCLWCCHRHILSHLSFLLCYVLGVLWFHILSLGLWSIFKLLFVKDVRSESRFIFFAFWCLHVPAPFVDKIFFPPNQSA